MKYPKLLKNNDLVGITALSSGAKDCKKDMENAIKNINKHFNSYCTKNVYGNSLVSSSVGERVNQLYELLEKKVKLVLIARGGDYLYEILDYLDFNKIRKNNIWIEGSSDATSLLYILTTKYYLATIYGKNAKKFSNIQDDTNFNIEFLKNMNLIQSNYKDRKTISVNGNFFDSGIIIGGCLDSIRNIIGTKYDNTVKFVQKYREKKVIWYFDIFAMDSLDVYLTLLQLKSAGWFNYSDTFIFGTVKYPKIMADITYEDAIKKALSGKKNIILEANIGHVDPVNIIINGSYASITYKNGKYEIIQLLKDK